MSSDALNERVQKILARIKKAGGENVKIVAAVKSRTAQELRSLLALGIRDFGESYVEEFLGRDDLLEEHINWHFIGQLQSNKVKSMAPLNVGLFQSVDRRSLIERLAKHFPGREVLIQLDTTGRPGRGGAPAAEVPDLVEQAADAGLFPKGIMLIAQTGIEASTEDFRMAKKLQESLELELLSAGMSGDFERALAEGSNMLRLGKILFEPTLENNSRN